MAGHSPPTPEEEVAQPVDATAENLLGRPMDADPDEGSKRPAKAAKK